LRHPVHIYLIYASSPTYRQDSTSVLHDAQFPAQNGIFKAKMTLVAILQQLLPLISLKSAKNARWLRCGAGSGGGLTLSKRVSGFHMGWKPPLASSETRAPHLQQDMSE
jgi:hypothetical protein